MTGLRAPFPYFGGKGIIADVVWRALGQPKHYLEPFFGSGAVLLARPNYDPDKHIETVCDADGHLCNVWRAMQLSPGEVAKWCDWPVNHIDLHARRHVLLEAKDSIVDKLAADTEWHDARLAGYWIWCTCCWIGVGMMEPRGNEYSLCQLPHITHSGSGVHRPGFDWPRAMSAIQNRMRGVRVVCGDWTRICGGEWHTNAGPCGFFFDPPYGELATRHGGLYACDSMAVATDVQSWCIERASMPGYRIVLAGYLEEHEPLLSRGWTAHRWKAQGGYGNLGGDNANRKRETLFMSPGCLKTEQLSLLGKQ